MLCLLFSVIAGCAAVGAQMYWAKYSGNLTQSYIVAGVFCLCIAMAGRLFIPNHICLL